MLVSYDLKADTITDQVSSFSPAAYSGIVRETPEWGIELNESGVLFRKPFRVYGKHRNRTYTVEY